jgi:hypothetical protein
MNLKRIALTVGLYCVGFSSALAQFTSSIQGVVTDAAGAAVPEAVVRVTNVASGLAVPPSHQTKGFIACSTWAQARIA